MGNSTGRGVHVSVPLAKVSIGYRPHGLIADKVFPIVETPKQNDTYYIWNQEDSFRIDNTERAPGSPTRKVTRSASSGTFHCKNYALSDDIPVEDFDNADPGWLYTEEVSRVEYIQDKLGLDWELRLAQQCTSANNVGSSSTVTSAWTDHTAGNSDPIGDVKTGINNAYYATGYRPRGAVFGVKAWEEWKEHADVIDRIYGNMMGQNGARIVTQEASAALLELDWLLVGGAFYNSGEEGGGLSLSDIWGDHVLVYFTPTKPSKNKPSFGYTFRWKPTKGPFKGITAQAKKWYDDDREAEIVKNGYYQDEKLTASALSFLIRNVTSEQ